MWRRVYTSHLWYCVMWRPLGIKCAGCMACGYLGCGWGVWMVFPAPGAGGRGGGLGLCC
jgi:hypothetical protein